MALKCHLLPRCQGCDLESPLPIPRFIHFWSYACISRCLSMRQQKCSENRTGALSSWMAHSLAPSSTLHLFNQSFHPSTNHTIINHKQIYIQLYTWIYLCTWLNAIIILQHFVVVVEVCQDLPDIEQKTHHPETIWPEKKSPNHQLLQIQKSLCKDVFLSSLVGNFLSFDLLELSKCLFADQEGLVKLCYNLNPGKPALFLEKQTETCGHFPPKWETSTSLIMEFTAPWSTLMMNGRILGEKRDVCSYGQWSY